MADTSFSPTLTTILSAWLNPVNKLAYWGRSPNVATTTGSADAQVLTLATGSLYTAGSEATGDCFLFIAGYTNTGAATLQVLPSGGSNTAVAIQLNGAALTGGEIIAGQPYMVVRKSTTWQLFSLAGTVFGTSLLQTASAATAATLLEVISNSLLTTTGDMIVAGAASTPARLPASATVAAHATTMDPWVARVVTLSGSAVTFTDLADADYVGQQVMLIMNAAHIWTDAAPFDVQGGQNYTAAAGDLILLTATAVDAFDVTIFKASGATTAKLPTTTVITSGSGTYNTPAGCTSIVVEGWAGGASGGGGDGTNRGTGGGGGGYFKKRYNNPAATYSYSVAAAAAAVGQGSGGTSGNATTFDTCTANGGAAGLASNGGAQGGVAGGTATGGDENIQGGSSTTCGAAGAGAGTVSFGGDSPRGGFGGKVNVAAAGQIPGGGASNNNTTGTGAAGARGQIVITEYYT